MPRNASGTYTLPTGNPVVSGTLIDATWANNTLNDVANTLTGSLSRSGEGGMLAPLRLNDGVQATPGLAFSNEPSTGLYRAGTNEMWAVAGGTQVLQVTNNGAAARFAAGSVGTPSITALGDLNTGLWFPAADTVALSTNGVERLRVGSGGDIAFDTNVLFVDAANNRVGVGTITPAVALDVNGGLSIQSANNLTWGGAYGATTPAISGAAGFLAFYPNGSTSGEIARLTSTGLGIGTASPSARLHVVGNQYRQNDSTGSFGFVINTTAATTRLETLFGGSSFAIRTNGDATDKLLLDSSGNLGIGTASPAARLQVKSSAAQAVNIEGTTARGSGNIFAAFLDPTGRKGYFGYGSASDDGFYLYNEMNAPIVFATNNTERMRITSAGNIVAGASAALATTATDGFLYVPTCAGTPTGTPTAITGMAPVVVNTTNNKLYFYSGGAWRDAGP